MTYDELTTYVQGWHNIPQFHDMAFENYERWLEEEKFHDKIVSYEAPQQHDDGDVVLKFECKVSDRRGRVFFSLRLHPTHTPSKFSRFFPGIN